jgi:hypothetical protein
MLLLYPIVTLVVVGMALWATNAFIAMDRRIRPILNTAVNVGLLRAFGRSGHPRAVIFGG